MATHSMCQPGLPAAQRAAVPARLALPGGHPEHRVERVLLTGPLGVAATLGGEQSHRFGVEAGHLAEVRVALHREVDVALEFVRRAAIPQPLDERHDAGYRFDSADVVLRRQHPQGGHILAEEGRLTLSELGPVLAVADGPLQQRIVHIGDVLDVVNLPLGVEPHALNEVERVVSRRVTDVSRVVRRDAAHVDTGDGTGVQGDPAAGRGVVNLEVARPYQAGREPQKRARHASHERNRTSVPSTNRTGH